MADEQNITEENQEALEKGDENILLWATLGISFGIDIFITELERDLATNGRIFGGYRNTLKRGIISTIMQASRQGQDSVYGDRLDFAWISVGSPKICIDCEGRIGQIDTWENWEERGLPASGFSICKERCYCQLIPTDIEMDETVIVA